MNAYISVDIGWQCMAELVDVTKADIIILLLPSPNPTNDDADYSLLNRFVYYEVHLHEHHDMEVSAADAIRPIAYRQSYIP